MRHQFEFNQSFLDRSTLFSKRVLQLSAFFCALTILHYSVNAFSEYDFWIDLGRFKLTSAAGLLVLIFTEIVQIRQLFKKIMVILVVFIATLTLIGSIFQSNFLPSIFQLPLASSFCLLGLGLSLLLKTTLGQNHAKAYQLLNFTTCSVALVCLFGFVFGQDSIQNLTFYRGMSLAAAINFVGCSFFFSTLEPQAGWLPILTSDNKGGRLLRTAFPSCFVTLAIIAGLINYGADQGHYDHRFAFNIIIIAAFLIFGFALLAIGLHLNRADRKYHITEREYADLYDHSPDMLLSVDRKTGHVIKCNKTLLKNLGYEEKELIGRSITNLYADESKAELDTLWKIFLEKGHLQNRELVVLSKDGRKIDVSLNSSAIRNHDGEIVSSRSTWRDISETKIARELAVREQAAAEGSRIKTNFLATMSHEIRTPLNGVIGMSEILMSTSLNPLQKDYADTIKQSADTLLTLVNDILDFSKIESGKVELSLEPFELDDLLIEVKKQMTWSASRKNLKLILNLETETETKYWGDRHRIKQVLTNLVSNAIKFTSIGQIEMGAQVKSTEGQLSRVCFEVRDTGIGISSEDFHKLFHPFSQTDSTVSRRFGGTGLGLSISQNLIQMMKSEIKVESEIDKGSRFYFELDLQHVSSEPNQLENILPKTKPVAGKDQILVVEDIDINRKVIGILLEDIGYEVAYANDGWQALTQIENFNFDCILMDCHMPGLNGYETAKRIRAHFNPKIRALPIVALTANASIEDQKKCLAAGMNDYLSKPVHRQALVHMLERWIRSNSPVGVSEMTTNPLLQLSQIQKPGTMSLVGEVVDLFEKNLPQRLKTIAQSLDEKNASDIARHAHALKSSAAVLGGTQLGECCDLLSRQATEGDFTLASESFRKCHQLSLDLILSVRQWVASQAS